MTFSTEEQLESLIFESRDKIHEKGLPPFYKNTIRQFVLPTKKKIDLFTYEIKDHVLFFRVIELKKDLIFNDAIWQILGYTSTVKSLTDFAFSEIKFDMVLIGAAMNIFSTGTLPLIPNLRIFCYDFKYDGISFKEEEYYESMRSDSYEFCSILKGEPDEHGFLDSPYKEDEAA